METEMIIESQKDAEIFSNDYELINQAQQGVTKRHLKKIAGRLKLSMRAMAKLLKVSERTLSRYSQDQVLKEPVSEHILQIERVVDAGEDVFVDPEIFLKWIRQPCSGLGGEQPINLLSSITGVGLVSDELVRIDYGIPI